MSCTSGAKEYEEPGRGGSRPSRDPKSMQATPLRPTKIEVIQERSDEKEHISSHFNRLTWGMLN
eukprot:CAMPEP_0172648494 /NCGR_PEP_ID=MMETSP1068-20121228/241299_1 /TAXON_ID=35684 /ORGANISM="Pseudopedinella elastica, Strain CCMP716" /LENGTH=63 /DNA_ID=CAMNT_0013462815 /DNA_START=1088 /DNA_END=1279 /DNA_ORIENTATION=+